ncbi:hypothetical protein BHE74_00008441 [Ensete ventricosum]|nr:hypothetical protein BHE74_00008441 [Ensete ventricosum]
MGLEIERGSASVSRSRRFILLIKLFPFPCCGREGPGNGTGVGGGAFDSRRDTSSGFVELGGREEKEVREADTTCNKYSTKIVVSSRPGDSFEVTTDHAERGDVGPSL